MVVVDVVVVLRLYGCWFGGGGCVDDVGVWMVVLVVSCSIGGKYNYSNLKSTISDVIIFSRMK